MWQRKEIKMQARQLLKLSYWKAFLVSLVLAFATGTGSVGGFRIPMLQWSFKEDDLKRFFPDTVRMSRGTVWRDRLDAFLEGNFDSGLIPVLLIALVGVLLMALFMMILALSLRVFLGFPLEVGGRRFFTRTALADPNMNHLGYAFEKGRYWPIVKGMFLRGLYNFLWYLLFIIPGIIKTYSYRMVPYILAENPEIGSARAISLSRQMMRGNKFRVFLLDLSFLGWLLLGLLAFVIGTLFVMPYLHTTYGLLYIRLREQADMTTTGEVPA